ncbi:hypothetical protein C882_3448 [Caenispirillum salinarum AK4]|uniref:Antitoxin FitA-like ribbon-helix-helix domain-containing protein n=1 Tax=Caenispirillum salinarum AK4 TaxID=1238182 RepID=K9HN18_9PROT|nr:hypothetical protein [Caenispirillum salinarum]EKV31698.1 hypothetical protein C882_3448 [Caenispirillum salinarum AK4]
MPSMTVRDLPEDVLRRLDQRAAAAGRSREKEVRAILTESVSTDEAWDRFDAAAAMIRRKLDQRVLSSSVDDLADARRERDGDA